MNSDLKGLAAREQMKAMSKRLTDHFLAKEFYSHDHIRDEEGELVIDEDGDPIVDHRAVPIPAELQASTLRLAQQLEVLREELGGKPVTVYSGYRTPYWNKHVGGEKGSKHLKALAADIAVKGVSPKEVADTIERLIEEGRMEEGGLGRYRSFTHYDPRGRKARWGSN